MTTRVLRLRLRLYGSRTTDIACRWTAAGRQRHCEEPRPDQSPDLGEEAAVDGAGEHPPQARRKPVHDGQALRARQERNVMGQEARACVRP